jgi:hypothetical protein
LRIAVLGTSYQAWVLTSFVTAPSRTGVGWNWLPWQAGPHWGSYVAATRGALRRARERPVSEGSDAAYLAIARFKYLLEPTAAAPPPAPWRRRAANALFTLWEQPAVVPMASAYGSYVLTVGEIDQLVAGAIGPAFARGSLIVAGGAHLSGVPPDLVAGAALVRCGPGACDDAAGRVLAGRHAGKLIAMETLTEANGRWSAFVRDAQPSPSVPVHYARPGPERIALEVDAGMAARMVLVSEAYHPWWQATVDGQRAPVLRAQVAFMGVPVGPGRHVVQLRLVRPPLVTLADRVTAVAWFVVVAGLPLAGAVRWRARRTGGTPRTPPDGRRARP